MSAIIHFEADGWKARTDGDFTEENVVRIADAAGEYWNRRCPGAMVYVCYDARPGAEECAKAAARTLAAHGVAAVLSDRVVPTPALTWAVSRNSRVCGGIAVTGSHYPYDYLGVKLCNADGGTGCPDFIEEIERLIEPEASGMREHYAVKDFVTPYFDYLSTLVDGDAIAAARLKVVYDPMYGASRTYMPQLLGALGVEVEEIHGADDEGWNDLRPEPIEPWVDDCEQAVIECEAHAGLINDGDAARVGAVDEKGNYVSPQKIMALVLGHLVVNRGMTGRVVVNQATSVLARRVAQSLGCKVTVRPIGFTYIYEEMRKGDVLLGGEGSGGFAIPSHVAERDGLLVNVLLCELMATTGKKLGELVNELEMTFGRLWYGRRDVRVQVEQVEMLRTIMPGLNPELVGGRKPVAVSHMDGLRFEFQDESWLLLRPSASESVVRVYAEAPSVEVRDELLDAGADIAKGNA